MFIAGTRIPFHSQDVFIITHSAGIGRTGVFIGADIGMRELEETQSIDVLKTVANLRQDRGGMVQTKDQYVFLHKVSTILLLSVIFTALIGST